MSYLHYKLFATLLLIAVSTQKIKASDSSGDDILRMTLPQVVEKYTGVYPEGYGENVVVALTKRGIENLLDSLEANYGQTNEDAAARSVRADEQSVEAPSSIVNMVYNITNASTVPEEPASESTFIRIVTSLVISVLDVIFNVIDRVNPLAPVHDGIRDSVLCRLPVRLPFCTSLMDNIRTIVQTEILKSVTDANTFINSFISSHI